jgi:hypothetical protein
MNCKICGEEFSLTDKQRDFFIEKGLKMPRRCNSCRILKTKIAVTVTCSKCGDKYILDGSEVIAYITKYGIDGSKLSCGRCLNV